MNNEDFKDVDKMRTIHEAFQFLCQTFADDVVKNTMANKKLGAMDTGPYRVSGMYFMLLLRIINKYQLIKLFFSLDSGIQSHVGSG